MGDKEKAAIIRKMARMFDNLEVSRPPDRGTHKSLPDGRSDNEILAEMVFGVCFQSYVDYVEGLEQYAKAVVAYTKKVSEGYAFFGRQYELKGEKDGR